MVKLAEALLRRKELAQKVEQLRQVKDSNLLRVVAERRQVSENVDDIVMKVPLVSVNEATKAYDYYARQLRLVDGVIQQANWTTEVDVGSSMVDYEGPEEIVDDRMAHQGRLHTTRSR